MGELTPAQKAWAKKLKRTLDAMPDGIEAILSWGTIDLLPAGFYKSEIYDTDTDMMQGGRIIEASSLLSISIDPDRIRPNSESI